jgi:predicted DNA-binding transcriptional regulator AlpA
MAVPRLFAEQQAAQILRVTVKALQKWRVTGAGPRFVKIGRLVRYTEEALEEYIQQRTVASTAEHTVRQSHVAAFTTEV